MISSTTRAALVIGGISSEDEAASFGSVVELELLLVAAIALAVSIPSAVVAVAILRAASLPHPALLVAVLGVLTSLSVVGFILTEATPLATLAGAGMGAIAGAVTAMYNATDKDTDSDGVSSDPDT